MMLRGLFTMAGVEWDAEVRILVNCARQVAPRETSGI